MRTIWGLKESGSISSVEQQIIALAREFPDQETCGFVTDTNGMIQAIAVVNHAENTYRSFEIAPEDFAKYEENAIAIWHSHPQGPAVFSPADVVNCKESELPWILYHTKTGQFVIGDPTGHQPYEERDWVYGLNDCFGLVRDWVKRELNFDFPDIDRYEDDTGKPSLQLLESLPDLMRSSGLIELEKGEIPQYGDVLFLQCDDSPLPNHCAVLINPSENKILHHLRERPSKIDYYSTFWRDYTVSIWRIPR